MKHNPHFIAHQLPQIEATALQHLRDISCFDPEKYIERKVKELHRYFSKCGISAALVAISGGVDSAIVLGILAEYKKKYELEIYAVNITARGSDGVVLQQETADKSAELMKVFGQYVTQYHSIDITKVGAMVDTTIVDAFGMNTDQWARGQAIPYLRTATLYSITALLSANGKRSVLVGTTNKSEGKYLGYIGKASDGMVDVQIISDIYKSEVYQVAEYLGVPSCITNAAPNGDMYDGRTDEQVFGATYDCVEYAIRLMELDPSSNAVTAYIHSQCGVDETVVAQMNNIDELHKYNRHKYYGASPAVHLDVIPNPRIYEGWKTSNDLNM